MNIFQTKEEYDNYLAAAGKGNAGNANFKSVYFRDIESAIGIDYKEG